MDIEGIRRLLSAQLRKHHVLSKGPSDPNDPHSVEDHERELREIDNEIVLQKLRISDSPAPGDS